MENQDAAPRLLQRGWFWATTPLAWATVLLLAPLAVIALRGLRAAVARYFNGLDGQLNRIGFELLMLALVGTVATALSTWVRVSVRLRWTLRAIALVTIAIGFVWGLPAESRGRDIAHHCACAGG